MEGDRIFHATFGDFSDIPRWGIARAFDHRDGIFVDYPSIFLEYSLYGSGDGAHRQRDDGHIFVNKSTLSI